MFWLWGKLQTQLPQPHTGWPGERIPLKLTEIVIERTRVLYFCNICGMAGVSLWPPPLPLTQCSRMKPGREIASTWNHILHLFPFEMMGTVICCNLTHESGKCFSDYLVLSNRLTGQPAILRNTRAPHSWMCFSHILNSICRKTTAALSQLHKSRWPVLLQLRLLTFCHLAIITLIDPLEKMFQSTAWILQRPAQHTTNLCIGIGSFSCGWR